MENDISWLFGYAEKQLDKKAMVNFKIYDVTGRTKSNYNIHIAQTNNQTMKFGQLIVFNMKNIFLEKSYTKCGEANCRLFCKNSKLIISDYQPEIL